MDDMQEMISEFIVDCSENLEEFENNLLDLERDPNTPGILDSMFRMIHSIKGASGFLAFANLESLTHKTESVLDLLRNDKGTVDQALISTFLDVCDAMRTMFDVIQEEGNDGDNSYNDLVTKLLNYESNFKTGEPGAAEPPAAAAEPAAPEAPTASASPAPESTEAESEELDPVQIEALKSLGMYEGEEAPASQEAADDSSELDPVQIEALKSLGMYEGEEAPTSQEKEDDNSGLDPVQIEALKALGMYDGEETVSKEPEKKAEEPKKVEEPKAEKKPEEKKVKKKAPVQKKETIRVEVDTLDRLVNLAGELVLVRNQLLELAKTNESQTFDASFTSLDIVTGEMQRTLMTTRMQPISTVWSKMPRIVRDLSAQLGREIELVMQGENTELDKTIIEAIADPMTHIIRNCCDHGIEMPDDREASGKPRKGTIKLVAEHRGNWIHVDVIDDGKGISREVLIRKALEKGLYTQEQIDQMDDKQILNIIFHPGFSTKEAASNISGRGVGMDVIKSNIVKINGTVELTSEEGKGTHLKMKLPLTLAIIPAVIVSIDDSRYAIPQNAVQEVAVADRSELEQLDNIGGQKFTRLRGQILPLVFASEFLGTKAENNEVVTDENSDADEENHKSEEHNSIYYVVINTDGFRFGLVIDKVLDIIEIVVKPLDSDQDFHYYAGATIMGDGKVALILDSSRIGELSKINKNDLEEAAEIEAGKQSSGTTDLTLTFRLLDGKNYLIPLSKTSRIEEIDKSNIEERQVGTFAKFNNKVIRVINLMNLLGVHANPENEWVNEQSTLKALYFEFDGHGIAIDVGFDHTLLQHDYDIEATHNSEFVVGTTLIEDTVYEVLNLEDYLGKVIGDLTATASTTNTFEVDEDKAELQNLSNDMNNTVISFQLGDLWFGIDLESISEIIATEEVTKTPGSRDSVEGLLNLRGDIMVTRKLADVLAMSSEDLEKSLNNENNRSIIIHENDNKMCLQIGIVDEILNLHKDDFYEAPANIPENILAYLKGVYNIKDQMLLLLDQKKLIADIVVQSN